MKLGLIGLKGHQNYVLSGARKLGGCEIVAISDDDASRVESFKRREPLARDAQVYTDWRHLTEHSLMDACIVADENGVRAEQLIDLARRGVHIISEKPLATTLEDLRRVRRALEKSSSRLTMLLMMRDDARYATARKMVAAGVVGRVRQVACQKSYRLGDRPEWQKHRERLGGTIPYIGIHALDLMSWVVGSSFTRVAAFHSAGARPSMKETEDSASILVLYENGATGTARLDYLRPATAPSHGDDRLRVAGTEGVLEIAYPQEELLLISAREGSKRVQPEPPEHLFIDFVKSLRTGSPSRIPAADCFDITEVVLYARQAADDQKMIELPRREGR